MATIPQRTTAAVVLATASATSLGKAMTNTLPQWSWLPSASVVGAIAVIGLIASVGLGLWVIYDALKLSPSFATARSWLASWRVQWPLARPLRPAPTSSLIYNARCWVYFDRFEQDNVIKLMLVFFNGTDQEIVVESVAGHLSYGVMSSAIEWPPIAWLDSQRPPMAKPLQDFGIGIQQHLRAVFIPELLAKAGNGGNLSIEFHLKIKAKIVSTGELVDLQPWQGVVVTTSDRPMISGRLVYNAMNIPVETQRAELWP